MTGKSAILLFFPAGPPLLSDSKTHPLMRFEFVVILLLLVLPADQVPAQSAEETGTIVGRVLYAGGAVHRTLNFIKDETTCGSEELVDESLLAGPNGELAWAVVGIASEIQGGKGLDALPGERALVQEMCVYRPHVVLAGVGQPFAIHNHDHTLHNVRTVSFFNDVVNKVQIYVPNAPAPVDTVTFTEPEVIEVLCDVHGWMKAYIHVVEHPYYQVTGEDGNFRLEDVPPGTYTLKVWHEKLGELEKEVEVKAGETTTVDFTFPPLKG